MNKKYFIYLIGMMLITFFIIPACSLKEEIKDAYTPSVIQADPNLLQNVVAAPLGQLRNLWWRQSVWGQEECTTDECFYPTRGTDWGDGGVWVQNYTLTWTPLSRDVIGTWNNLTTAISSCNTAIANIGLKKPNELLEYTHYRSQAMFLRCLYEYYMLDLYRVYPSRDPFSTDFTSAPAINTGASAFYKLVANVKATVPDMISRSNAQYGQPTMDAGNMLLAKLYLNEEVYTGNLNNGIFTKGVAGYDSALIYLNLLISSGNYGLASNYFNMFSVDNYSNYKKPGDEGILVCIFNDDQNYGVDDNVQWVKTTFHYNQNLGSTFANWNGACTPTCYLNNTWFAAGATDTTKDMRWRDSSIYPAMGVVLGFNYGQQYDAKTHAILKDRQKHNLVFTFDVALYTTAKNPVTGYSDPTPTEIQGVRVLKYPPRVVPVNIARCPNDFLIWRYADALLMKAECLVRGTQKDVGGAVALVNQIRTTRNAPIISASSVSDILNKIYIERGLELYWEGHRRQDMIRFGTFLVSKDADKNTTSPDWSMVMPIPLAAITGTPGGVLKQNYGY